MKKQIWNVQVLGSVQRTCQDKFVIEKHQMDLLSLSCSEEDWEKDYDVGEQLLGVMGMHLSIMDLRQIVGHFQTELALREKEREEALKAYENK